jgi:hypothetical protein
VNSNNNNQIVYINLVTMADAISEVQMLKYLWQAILLSLLLMTIAAAQAPPPSAMVDTTAPPPSVTAASNVTAFDTPNDAGGSITIQWRRSPDDIAGAGKFDGYDILRGISPDGPFEKIGDIPGGASGSDSLIKTYLDNDTKNGIPYYYAIDSKAYGLTARAVSSQPASSKVQWFNMSLLNLFIAVIFLTAAILYYISSAKAGKELYIRKIAGLEAVDEAVGRATEMGKKIFFIPGTQDMDNVQTIAGLTILGRVAKLTAEYEAKIDVPVSRSLVMVTAREVVKEAYLNAGRPDAYSDDMVYYLTDDQFGYAAGIDGLVVRQKPATIFYQGAFYAESLILAETGNSIGAIQIAGTAMPSQLPFFVASCDYTLIGEELFAASAYLSHEPKQLGSLKGQDLGKLIFILALVIGVIIQVSGIYDFSSLFNVVGGGE